MEKNRSAWSAILTVVLAMVVMAGLAVTAFAVTDGSYAGNGNPNATVEQLEAALESGMLEAGINYDIDGNGIIERDDLTVLKGEELPDLLPNGEKDMISLPLDDFYTEDAELNALQSLYVRGDSTAAIKFDTNGRIELLDWAEPQDFSSSAFLIFDAFWPGEVGGLQVRLFCGDGTTEWSLPVQPMKAGWSKAVVDLTSVPAADLASVWAVYFERAASGEAHLVYIDNMALESGTSVSFSTAHGSADAKQVIEGAPYGALPVLTQNFYTFEGWYLDANYTQKVTADTIVENGENHTLYAKWSKVVSDDGSVQVSDKGGNAYGITMGHTGYKQMRFAFTVGQMDGDFAISYADGDSKDYNNAFIVILDENNRSVRFADVVEGTRYTAVVYGVEDQYQTPGNYWHDGSLAENFTLTVAEGVQMEIDRLEALAGKLGYRLSAFETSGQNWTKVEVDGYGYVFDFHMANPDTHEHTGIIMDKMVAGQYAKFTYDFCIYERIDSEGNVIPEGQAAGFHYASWASLNPTFYDMNGNKVDAKEMKVGVWYKAVMDITGKSGQIGGYSFQGDTFNTSGSYKAYFANLNWEPAETGVVVNDIGTATTVRLTKGSTAGTFWTEQVSRDHARGIYKVAGSDNWAKRTLKIALADSSKEFVQVDFRFLSAEVNGAAVAPTMLVSTTFSGTPAAAQYIIVDEDDDPVTTLEVGKWYRMFITANGNEEFALVPMGEASGASFELQVRNLDNYNADELDVTIGGMSLALTKFGKLEYVHTGNGTFTAKLNSAAYKQIRFSAKLANANNFAITVSGAKTTIKQGSGDWHTVVITAENGGTLGTSLTLNISGNTGLRIKDLKAYTTTEDPVSNPSTQFRGLEADEMMLLGFLGPRDSYVNVGGGYLPSTIRDDVFKNLAAAGINYLADNNQSYSGVLVESSQEILRLAAKYGINYYMAAYDVVQIGTVVGKDGDKEIYESTIASADAILAKLKEMYQYESFGGLYLRDEPSTDLFDEIRTVIEGIAQIKDQIAADAVLNYYVNMFPNVGSRLSNYSGYVQKNGTFVSSVSWDDYLKYGITDTGMNYVSFDSYPFKDDGTNEDTFLNYLGRINKVAQTNNVPWMGAAQVGGGQPAFGDNRELTEAELNWDVNAMLAFGAKGIMYYVTVAPPYFNSAADGSASGMTMIDLNGETTKYYDYVAKINNQIKAMDHVLMNATHVGVIMNGSGLMSYSENTGKTNLLNTTTEKKSVKLGGVSGTAMIGAFDYNGQTALLVVNNDVEKANAITLTFIDSYAYEIIQDGLTSWQTGGVATLNLKAGSCALIVVHNSDDVTPEISLVFDSNYEGADVPSVITMPWSENAQYPELPAVKRSGYIFDGWYLDAECTGTPVAAGETMAVNGGHILYAKWTPDTIADIQITTSTTIGAAEWRYTEADGWHWYVPDNGASVAADYRRAMVTLPEDGMRYLSYEVKFNSLRGTATLMGITEGEVRYYDLETGALVGSQNNATLEIGKWYRVEYATNNGKNMGTSPWIFGYAGGFGEGNLSFSIRNMKASADPIYSVYFNKNYAGAEGAINSIVRYSGEAYGELPVLEDRGEYKFLGWFTDAAGENAVTEATAVESTHVLYAGWLFPDDSPIKVHNPAPNQWILSKEIVDGKALYTYTTRGAAYPVADPWARRVNFNFTAGQQTHVILEVRYTEAFAADGVTEIAPSLGIYCNNEGNGGSWISTIDFYDSNGKRVKGNEASTALTVGEWYTVVVGVYGNTNYLELRTAHNYTADAAILTMEIRDRVAYDGSAEAATLTTPWDVMPEPALSIVDGEVMRVIWAKDVEQAAYYRAFRAVMKQDGMGTLSFEYKMSNVNGGAKVGISGMKTYDLTTGELVSNPQADTWYKAVYSVGANLGTGNLDLGYLGGTSNTPGGFDMYIRNIQATELKKFAVSFDLNYEGATGAPADIEIYENCGYGTLPVPTREGYIFGGWYLNPECTGTEVNKNNIVTADHTLYALWSENIEPVTPDIMVSVSSQMTAATWRYTAADGWHWYIADNGESLVADNRHAIVTLPTDGMTILSYEVKFNGTSGEAVNKMGLMEGVNTYFDLETGALVGSGNGVALESGKWYRVVYKTNNAANMGTSAWTFAFIGGFGEGNASLCIRNVAASTDPAIKVTTSAAMGQANWQYSAADGWHWYVPDNGATPDADNRRAMVTLPVDGMRYLTYEVKFNSLSGSAKAIMGLMEGVNKYYDLETGELVGSGNGAALETGKWYKVEYATNESKNMGTNAWIFGFSGGFGAGNLSFSVRNVEAFGLPSYQVSFDLGYEGGETISSMTIEQGAAYGTLPTPATREGYTFGGWTLADGTVVAADTKVTSSHTLYAKWEIVPDSNPVMLEDNVNYNPYNAKLTHDFVDGKHVYTYTTKGVAAPAADAWSRRLNFTGWEEGTKYVAIEFRFTEAKTADGTDFAPSLGVYNGQSGVGYPRILDANGKVVAEGNSYTGLTVGQWYTVIVSPGSYSDFAFWPAHNHQTDAPQLTMEIRTRACTADPGLSQDGIKFETVWGDFADPSITYINGNWCYAIGGAHQSTSGEHRQMNVTLTNSNIKTIEFEFMMNGLNNTYVKMSGGVAKTIINLDGSAAGTLQTDTWYKVTATSETVFSTSRFVFGYLGGDHATPLGGLNVYIRNVVLTEAGKVDVSFDLNGAEGNAPAAIQVMEGSAYGTLPEAPTREFYTFGGWMLENGTVVTADTKVTASHTLYAKWELMPDPNTVVVGTASGGTKTVDIVDGKYVYTYSTSGVSGTLNKRLHITFPEGQSYVAVEFRITKSFLSDGVTDLDPYLRVYTSSNSGNGASSPINALWIYDSNGLLASSANDGKTLAVGQWYTLIVQMNSGTHFDMVPLSHYGTEAPVLTMEIRDRGTYAAPGKLETAWGDFPEPTLHFADGKFQYDLIGSAASVPGEHRQLNLTLSTDGMTHVMYEVMVENPTGGASATITSGNTVFYDLETGMKVTSFEEGKWYGATYTTGSNLGTSRLNLGYTGSSGATAGGIDVHIRNLRAFAADTNTAAAIATETYWGTLYRTGASTYRWATTNAVSGGSEAALYQRAIKFTNPLTTAAVMKVDFRFLYCTDSSGNNVAPNMWSNVTGGKFVVVDPENGEVMGSLEVGKTYSMYMTLDAGASANMQVCYGAAAGLRAGLEIVSSEAIAISASSVTMTPNSVTYGNVGLYQYNGEWAYGYSRYDGIHSEASGNTDYRKMVVNLDSTNYAALSFKFMYDEATNNGNKVTPIMFCTGYSALTSQVTDADGNTASIADMVAGQWYNVTLTMADGSALSNIRFFPAGQGNAASATADVNIRLRFKDFQCN